MRKTKDINVNENTTAGITLIALVITIIVLLILAGVSMSLVVGENGVLSQATQSVNETRKATAREEVQMAWTSADSERWGAWTQNTSAKKADFFTIDNLNKYLEGTGEVTELNYVENGTSTVKYLRYEENLEYTVEIYNTGKGEIVGEPITPVPLYDLATVAAIGDIVEYDAGDGVFNWSDYSYDATALATDENGTQNNFVASSYTGKWIVSNIDDDGYVYLISENSIGELYINLYDTDIALNIFETICSKYANTDFAETSRCVQADDLSTGINEILTGDFWLCNSRMWDTVTSHSHEEIYEIRVRNSDGELNWVRAGKFVDSGNESYISYPLISGIRPIIKLKSGIKTTGKNESNEWVLYKAQ